ncbi:MAG: tyrosine-type recombinase/integrase [Maritimibacter sp.]|nr:tyrosine-type recombinase/integrase [Maritimibacter sp.]
MKLPGLKRYMSGGNYYVYHRATGIQLPAHLPEDHPDFLDAYHDAKATVRSKEPEHIVGRNSIEDVARRYKLSEDFLDLSESYRDVRRRDIDRLLAQNEGKIAKVSFKNIEAKHVQKNLRQLTLNPANERLKTWRALFAFAIAEGIVTQDQSKDEKKRKHKGNKKRPGHLPWKLSEIGKYRSFYSYGTEERAMFEVLYWVGSRISDARALGPENETEDGFIEYTQMKTGEEAFAPIGDLPHFADPEDYEHFRRAIDAMGPDRSAYTLTIHGTIRSHKSASQWFSAAARAAGVKKTAHGLRKSRMIRNAECGATSHEIAAWSGHESIKEVEHYTRGVNRKNLLKRSVLITGQFDYDG